MAGPKRGSGKEIREKVSMPKKKRFNGLKHVFQVSSECSEISDVGRSIFLGVSVCWSVMEKPSVRFGLRSGF